MVTEMGTLVGKDIQGEWGLNVADRAKRDVGKINYWGVKINTK